MKQQIVLLVTLLAVVQLVSADSHQRSKRGITDFFRRFWGGRKKNNLPSPSTVFPLYNQDYLYGQASNMLPMYYGNNNMQQLQQQAQQLFAAEQNGPNMQQGFYQGYQNNGGQMNQYGGNMNNNNMNGMNMNPNNNQQGYNQGQQYNTYAQGEEANSQQMYGQGPSQQQQYMQQSQQHVQHQQPQAQQHYGGQQYNNEQNSGYYGQASQQYGTSVNPAQANTFHSQPDGSNAGTIDVHQVLDQFIRSAGLSPQGDHENAKGDQSYAESETKPVFTFKKLYSYPFYMSSSGTDKSSSTAYHGSSIRRQSSEDMLVNAALKNNLLASQKMNMFGDQKTVADDETSFIAKNAAALQEFLSNKVTENKISGGGGGVVASAASAGGNLNKHD